MPTVRYVGPLDAVVVYDGELEKVAANGETLDVSEDLAHGTPPEGVFGEESWVAPRGGLLDQPTNWEPVDAPAPPVAPVVEPAPVVDTTTEEPS